MRKKIDDDEEGVAHRYYEARFLDVSADRVVLAFAIVHLDEVWRQPRLSVPIRLKNGRQLTASLNLPESTQTGWHRVPAELTVVLDQIGIGALASQIHEVEVDVNTVGHISRLHLYPNGRHER